MPKHSKYSIFSRRALRGWLVFISFWIFLLFQNCRVLSTDSNPTQGPTLESTSGSGNGGVYGGLQPPITPSVVQPGQKVLVAILGGNGPFELKSKNQIGQITAIESRKFVWEIPVDTMEQTDALIVTDSQGQQASTKVSIQTLTQPDTSQKFGQSAAQLGNLYLISDISHDSSDDPDPTCRDPGIIQVFDLLGQAQSAIKPPAVFCHLFAQQIQRSGRRAIASGIHIALDSNGKKTMRAGAVVYRTSPSSRDLVTEQVLISNQFTSAETIGVGIQQNRLFLYFISKESQTGMIEIYQWSEDQWQLAHTIDFASPLPLKPFSLDPQLMANAVQFASLDEGESNPPALAIHAMDQTSGSELILKFTETGSSQWVLEESMAVSDLIPLNLLNAWNTRVISHFQWTESELIIDLNLYNTLLQKREARTLIFVPSMQGSSRAWILNQEITPPLSTLTANNWFMSRSSSSHLVIHHPGLMVLSLYEKQGGSYLPYLDLTNIIQSTGFPKNLALFENKIIVIYPQQALIFTF